MYAYLSIVRQAISWIGLHLHPDPSEELRFSLPKMVMLHEWAINLYCYEPLKLENNLLLQHNSASADWYNSNQWKGSWWIHRDGRENLRESVKQEERQEFRIGPWETLESKKWENMWLRSSQKLKEDNESVTHKSPSGRQLQEGIGEEWVRYCRQVFWKMGRIWIVDNNSMIAWISQLLTYQISDYVRLQIPDIVNELSWGFPLFKRGKSW